MCTTERDRESLYVALSVVYVFFFGQAVVKLELEAGRPLFYSVMATVGTKDGGGEEANGAARGWLSIAVEMGPSENLPC